VRDAAHDAVAAEDDALARSEGVAVTLWSLVSLACAPADLSDAPEAFEAGDELARPMMDLRRWYLDADRDGFGDGASFLSPVRPRGHVANDRDCLDVGDDAAATYPGAAYFENGGECETDADGDGFGSMAPASGVTAGLDCDDADSSTWCVSERTIGNDVEFADASSATENYLLGSAIEIPYPMVLSALALIGKSATGNVKMALYTDDRGRFGGSPESLIVATGANAIPVGPLEIAVEPTPVLPGTYWIMAVYDTTASIGIELTPMETNYVKYRSLLFSDPIPSSFGTATTYSGQRFNYYIVGY
jgi:hypothetical protein